jgi:hypothetical protein
LPNISTIQKPYFGSFPVPMASFGDALRPWNSLVSTLRGGLLRSRIGLLL